MSRWMIPFWWRVLDRLADLDEQLQPLAGVRPMLVAVGGDSARRLTNSITKYGRPLAWRRRRIRCAMFGWSMRASACRSASKRAITCLVSIPSLMILKATGGCTGSLLRHLDRLPAPFADSF